MSDVISPARRPQAVGAPLAVSVLTSAISVPAVALLADWGGWQFTFVLSGLLLASGFLANWLLFPRDNKERVGDLVIFSRYRSLISMNFFRVALPVNLTQGLAYWALVSFFAAYVINTYEVSVGFVALPLVLNAVGQVIGSYAAGFVAGRNRALCIAVTTVAGGFCGFLFFTADYGLWFAVAPATVGSGLLRVTFPALVIASTEHSGESKATGVGLMGLSNQSGGILGAGLAGALLANSGYQGIGYLCLILTIASAMIATLFRRQLGLRSE